MKRIVLILLVLAFTVLPLMAAPTDEEVAESLSGIFAVYGAVFMTSMMNQAVPGADLVLNLEDGSSTLTLKDVDVAALFASIGAAVDESGTVPEVLFTRISGSFTSDAEGDMSMDIGLRGGPVQSITLIMTAGELTELLAEGESYFHMRESLQYVLQ